VKLVELEGNRFVNYCIRKINSLSLLRFTGREILKFIILFKWFNLTIYKIRKQSNNQNRLLIGVDTIGLYWSSRHKKKKDKLFYLSLELVIEYPYPSVLKQYLKREEIKVHKNQVSLTMIQDKYRLESLKKINHIDNSHSFAILTNSPREHIYEHKESKNFFEEKFSIPKNSFKILSAGMIGNAVMSLDIAKVFSKFNDNTVYLIFHDRQAINEENEYLKKIRECGGANVVLSLKPVAYDMIYKIYTSADIGLVFYNPLYGENYSNIIGASGKLSHYLKYRMPIVCLDLPGFRELVDKYKCGVVIQDLMQMEDAVTEIRSQYSSMSEGAYKCYRECYNFDYQFEKIYYEWVK
jgi:glycosyltransferase involved in cell wall biosynthesis